MSIKNKNAKNISFILTSWMACIIIVTSLLFPLNISISYLHVILASVLVFWLGFYLKQNDQSLTEYIWIVLAVMIIIAIAVAFCSNVYMNAWDSNAYHKQAIGLLKYGWNPLFQSSFEFESMAKTVKLYSENPLTWAEVYPKAAWYFGANIYHLTGNIESAKSYTILSMIALFFMCYSYLRDKNYGFGKTTVTAIVVACNPIAMAQMKCFYLDGFATNIIIMIMLQIFILSENMDIKIRDQRQNWINLFMLIVIGCNLKISIILFTILICFVYYCYSLFYKLKICKQNLFNRNAIEEFIFFFLTGTFSIFIIGASPNITNIIRYKNIFYQTTDLLSHTSKDYGGIKDITSNFQVFFVSMFGKMSTNVYHTIASTLKIPFSVHNNELDFYSIADTRISGMGIFFSGIFLISIVIILINLFSRKKNISDYFKSFLLMSVFILCIITPLTYQLRYVGFIYIIPIYAIFILLNKLEDKKNYRIKYVVFVLFIMINVINILPWVKDTYKCMNQSSDIKSELMSMKKESTDGKVFDVTLINEQFVGLLYDLQDYDIKYNYVPDLINEKNLSGALGAWVLYKSEK